MQFNGAKPRTIKQFKNKNQCPHRAYRNQQALKPAAELAMDMIRIPIENREQNYRESA